MKNVRFYSYGGSGLKFITNYCRKYISCHDTNHDPHIRPSEARNSDKRLIIYSDPRNAVLSFIRRNREKEGWINQHLRNMGFKDRGVKKGFGLANFIKLGYDIFDLEGFFTEWYLFDMPQTAYVKYEGIVSAFPEIVRFLEMPEASIHGFTESYRKRSSTYLSVGLKEQKYLYNIYSSLICLQENLPNLYIK